MIDDRLNSRDTTLSRLRALSQPRDVIDTVLRLSPGALKPAAH